MPKPRKPKTTAQKQRELNASLDAIARSIGYLGWSDYRNCVNRGRVHILPPPDGWEVERRTKPRRKISFE